MADIGIITFHCADNFGAILQVYALQQSLLKLEKYSEIIDFRPEYLTMRYDTNRNWKKLINEIGIQKSINILLDILKNHNSIKERMKAFKKFRNEKLILSNDTYYTNEELIKNPPNFKYYITGSDQIWNPQFFTKIGNSYFLDFANEQSTKISYAASLAINVDSSLKEFFQNHLERFDFISIRESEHLDFIQNTTQKPVAVTLDPTLLLDSSDWDKISKEPNIQDKYILVYDLIVDEELIKITNRLVNEKDYKVISYSDSKLYKNYIKSFKYDGPSEFIGYIKKAEIILTNSFHGTVFSIIYNKPFYTIPHKTRGSRMVDLLTTLCLENRLVNSNEELSEIYYNLEYKQALNHLDKLKSDSLNFLKIALSK